MRRRREPPRLGQRCRPVTGLQLRGLRLDTRPPRVPGDRLMDLTAYDVILINSSAGKDSLAMLDYICEMAREQGVLNRVTVVHADLGRVEWAGTRELAERQAVAQGVPFRAVSRPQGDLLTHVEERGMWPDSARRYCTSDHN